MIPEADDDGEERKGKRNSETAIRNASFAVNVASEI